MHHLSCHTVTASRNATATSTSPAVVSVLPKEEVRSDAGETGGLKLPDVNMNNDIKVFRCHEPGCLFKTDYQSNMVRHKRNKHKRKHVPINVEEEKQKLIELQKQAEAERVASEKAAYFI